MTADPGVVEIAVLATGGGHDEEGSVGGGEERKGDDAGAVGEFEAELVAGVGFTGEV